MVRTRAWSDVLVGTGMLVRWARPWTSTLRAARADGLSFSSLVALAAVRDPYGTAIVDDVGRLTYAELDRHVHDVAASLGRDVRRVAVLGRNGRGLVVALAGAIRSGADVVVLNADMTPAQIASALTAEPVDVVLIDGDDLPRLPDAVAVIDVRDVVAADGSAEGSVDDVAAVVHPRTTGRRGTVVLLTSGTTGAPRGAHLARYTAVSAAPVTTLLRALPWRRTTSFVVTAPIFHGFGLGFLALGLAAGLPVVLHRTVDAAVVSRDLAARPCSVLVGVPPVLARVARHPPGVPVAAVVSGSGLLHPAVCARLTDAFGPVLLNLYGSSEEGWSTLAGPDDLARAPGTVGRAAAGIRVAVLDDDGRPVAPGQVGRIGVRSRLEFAHYTEGGRRPRLAGYADSGDLGHVDGFGLLHVDGRLDDVVVIGGENVVVTAVEAVLLEHRDVDDARVDAMPDEEWGARLVARVVPTTGADPGSLADDVLAHARARLPSFAVPRDVVVVDTLDRSATGTVRRERPHDGGPTA